jgi:carbon-monoxide dehydrogenase medium subunit
MKAARFDYERPATIAQAIGLLCREDIFVKAVAGSQSLGPMLNLRLVQPELLVDLTAIPELGAVQADGASLMIGACVTHAAIEDGVVPDVTGGALPSVARGIAYRAVRNRGTIGGSLAHADPSADWVSTLTAVGASVVLEGPGGRREVAMSDFMIGTFETVLQPGEIIVAVRVPRFSAKARFGYYKVCRKAGEFAQAIGAVCIDPARGFSRLVIGTASTSPIVIEGDDLVRNYDDGAVVAAMQDAPFSASAYDMKIHAVALRRAIAKIAMPVAA